MDIRQQLETVVRLMRNTPDPVNIDSAVKQIMESKEFCLIAVDHDGNLKIITKDMNLKPDEVKLLKIDNVWLFTSKKFHDVELIAVNDVELAFFKWWGHQITV